MKSKRVLLIGGNFSPEPTGIGKYNGEMIDWLSTHGYECAVVTTFPYYPQWKVQDDYAKSSYWYKTEKIKAAGRENVTVYRCPHYVPKNPSGLRRILSDASFFISALFQIILLLFTRKYDLVMTVVPAFHIGLLGIMYKNLKGATLLYHIQDLQIEAAQQLALIPSPTAIKVLYQIEAFILRRADLISTISEGMLKKVKAKSGREICLFPNWVDTRLFHPLTNKDSIKEEYGFQKEDKIILYSGAIGEKQGLEGILHAAKALQHHSGLKFVICGSGPYKEKLQNLKRELVLENVFFLPLQPFEKLNRFLNMADLHLVLQKGDASDLVMPSKLTTILATGGLTLVTAIKDTSLFDVITTHNMGIAIEPEHQEALNNAILKLLSEDHEPMKENARAYAQRFIAIDGIFNKFIADVDQLTNKIEKSTMLVESPSYTNETVA